MVSQHEFAQRRQQVIDQIGDGSVAIVPAALEYMRNADADYRYRQNSDFYYLTGFAEPGAVLVLLPGRKAGQYVLFNRPRDPLMETWYGRRAGQEGAKENFAVDESYDIAEIDKILPELLHNCQRVYYPLGRNAEFDKSFNQWLNQVRSQARAGVNAPTEFFNIEDIVHNMRLRKSETEIALMRKASQLSAQAHIRAMQACRPGMYEYELEAEIMYEFYRQGCKAAAYNSIVGGGENACILHYVDNDAVLRDGDIVLIDAGGEYQFYAADITRSFPVNGRFSAEQRALYDVVLAAEEASINKLKPGATWGDMHDTAVRVLTEGLCDLGILKGKVDDLIADDSYFKFYMHRTGHWIGLDVHDVGRYKNAGAWATYEAGMVTTVEPGIYISAGTEGVDEKWWDIGIRIEDDVLITADGHDVLTKDVPKKADDIEALMRKD